MLCINVHKKVFVDLMHFVFRQAIVKARNRSEERLDLGNQEYATGMKRISMLSFDAILTELRILFLIVENSFRSYLFDTLRPKIFRLFL